MQTQQFLLECLEQKREKFAEYEDCTNQLCTCDFDDMEKYITRRSQLANEIDRIDAEIRSICDSDPERELWEDALANRGDYMELPEEMRIIYDVASEVLGMAHRIYNKNPEIVERMQRQQAVLKENIKKGSNTAKTYRYIKNLEVGPAGYNIGNKI